jgi:cytochrome c oxidase assembly factor CtaG
VIRNEWSFDPAALAAAAVALALYAQAWLRLRQRSRPAHPLLFAAGVAAGVLAVVSPLDAIAEEHLVSAHMLQHGLLMSVAPPLLLLGLYPRLVVPYTRPVLKPLLRDRRAHAVLRSLSAPALALGLWLAVLYVWHLPALYQSALRNEGVHVAQHLFFVNAGLLFWLPVIEPVPALARMRPLAKLGYLAAGQVGTALLAAALVWGPELYHFYDPLDTLWGLSHAADQRLAGLVMMVVDMLVALTAAGWIVLGAPGREAGRRRLSPAVE